MDYLHLLGLTNEEFSEADLLRSSEADSDPGLRPWTSRFLDFSIQKLLTTPSVSNSVLNILALPLDDDLFIDSFPFRTKKDQAIRRSRAADMLLFSLKEVGLEKTSIFLTILIGFDYISVINIMRMAIFFKDVFWFETWHFYKAFRSPEDFLEITKEFSVQIKNSTKINSFLPFIENYNLFGYRNLPYSDFNVIKECSDLAGSGQLNHDKGCVNFRMVVNDIFPLLSKKVDDLTFEQFVKSGVWTTAGASSLGKLKIVLDGKEIKIKARKNIAIDVLDLDDLIKRCLSVKKSVNTSVIKSELGKIRLAVAGDLESYLLMSYLNYYLNGTYLDWPGNTLEETVYQSLSRSEIMCAQTAKGYQLPFDFSNFDHQPTLDELTILIERLNAQCLINASVNTHSEVKMITEIMLNAFKNSQLKTRDSEGDDVIFPVKGGLMSGMRWTSLIGNMWNTVISTMVTQITDTVVKSPLLMRFIRGDDSALFCKNFQAAYVFKKSYDFLNVKTVPGKFAIMKGYMEFLRIQYTPYGMYSYAARSVPNYLQSKPWNPMPWSPFSSFDTLKDVCDVLNRRDVSEELTNSQLDISYNILIKKMNIPHYMLQLPKVLGGIGVYKWDGKFFYPGLKSAIQKAEKPLIDFLNLNDWREKRWETIVKKFTDLPIIKNKLQSHVKTELTSILMGDEITDLKSPARVTLLNTIKKFQFKKTVFKTVNDVYPSVYSEFSSTLVSIDTISKMREFNSLLRECEFGSFPSMSNIVKELSIVGSMVGVSSMSLLKKNFPIMYDAVKKTKYKHLHLSTTIDFLSGELPTFVSTSNPLVSQFKKNFIGYHLSKYMRDFFITLDRDNFLLLSQSLGDSFDKFFNQSVVYTKFLRN